MSKRKLQKGSKVNLPSRKRAAQQAPQQHYPNLGGIPPASPLGNALIGANLFVESNPRGAIESLRRPTLPQLPGNVLTVPLQGPAGMGTGSPNYAAAVRADPKFQEFEYQHSKLLPLQQQLGNLTAQSMIGIPSTGMRLAPTGGPSAGNPVNYGNFEGLDLRQKPIPLPGSNYTADFYDPNPRSKKTYQRMVLSPARGSAAAPRINPVITFTHEGRHAIDDLYKRPHQTEMINFLAEEEGRQTPSGGPPPPLNKWLQPLIEGAQSIIPVPAFKQDYPYSGKKGFEDNITTGFKQLSIPASPVNNFQTARTTLNTLRNTPSHGGAQPISDPEAAFFPLSEFHAFSMEGLGLGQNWNSTGIPDASRRFTKENLRTMYRDYNELVGGGTNLASQYPAVHEAFFDRYNDLRNPNYGPSLSSGVSQNPNYLGKTRQQASLEKMGAPPVPAGSGTLPILPLGAPQVPKPALTAFTPGIGGAPATPNAFPAPKYTNRAKGGYIKTKPKKRGLFSYFNN